MKTLYCILLTIFISCFTQAQQVTKIDCCIEIGGKAAIIINHNSSNGTSNSAPVNTTTINGGFDFKLDIAANTSAGVYDKNDFLVRTLWSGLWCEAGCYSGKWDGYLDDGTTLAPLGTYTVKTLTNNVAYDWLGVIGNSSASHLRNEFLIGNGIYSLAVANGNCYMAAGYAEREVTTKRFALNNIGACFDVSPGTQSVSAFAVCSNSNMVFYAGEDSYSQIVPKFLYAFNPVTEQQITFTNSRSYSINIDGRVYSSVLGYSEDNSNHILSIAATDSFLFVARQLGTIEVYDLRNNSGALLFTTSITGISRIDVAGNKLWAVINGVPKQYSIASNGALSVTGLALNLNSTYAIKFNSFANEIAVSDLTAQTYKFYDASTGNYKSTVGVSGGYANGPAVTDFKFCLQDIKGRLGGQPVSDIAFQSDGSFWITDIGNYRINRYNPDHTYKDQIAYVPSSRSCAVDINNPTRVFADALEYQIDYSKVATDINGSWKLKYNWSVNTDLNIQEQFKGVFTLPNGFTYAYGSPAGPKHLYHLDPINGAVYLKDIPDGIMEADGSLYDRPNNGPYFTVTKRTLTSGNNVMLTWGEPIVMAQTPNIDANFPFYYIQNTRGAITNQSRQFFYNPVYGYGFGNNGYGNHLVSIKNNTNTIEWQASKSTGVNYFGEYPRNGDFVTNAPGQAGSRDCLLNINGRNLFMHVNDELGIYTQVARTNHFDESGLFIGHFGTDNKTVSQTGDPRFWAGNSFSTNLAKVGNDLYYFYCDESKHAGVHLVKVSNLASIAIKSIPLTVSAAITPVADPSDLMTSLPKHVDNFAGNNDWIIVANPQRFSTTKRTYLSIDNDVAIGTNISAYVKRRLSTNTLDSWKLSGYISFEESQATLSGDAGVYNYLDLTDNTGKVIARFAEMSHSYADRYLTINGVTIPGSYKNENNFGELQLLQPFKFSLVAGVLRFKIAGYDEVVVSVLETGAAINKPGYLSINQSGIYGNRFHQINLKGLRFNQ